MASVTHFFSKNGNLASLSLVVTSKFNIEEGLIVFFLEPRCGSI